MPVHCVMSVVMLMRMMPVVMRVAVPASCMGAVRVIFGVPFLRVPDHCFDHRKGNAAVFI